MCFFFLLLFQEYMYHRKHTFMRLDGSSKISDRRDMVADFQKRSVLCIQIFFSIVLL